MVRKRYFRKIAFVIGPHQQLPGDPAEWARSSLDEVLAMSWKGDIPTVKALLDHYTHWVYADRKVLRKQVFWGEALPDLKETLFKV